MKGKNRRQATLLPECLDDYVAPDNPARIIEAFVDELDLAALGFAGLVPERRARIAHRSSSAGVLGQVLQTEGLGHGDGHHKPAGLERSGWEPPLVLHENLPSAQVPQGPRQGNERRGNFTQAASQTKPDPSRCWVNLSASGKLRGETHGILQGAGRRDAFADDVECRSMSRGREDRVETCGHGHATIETSQLRRDLALVMVHGNNPIVLACKGLQINRVRRERAAAVDPALRGRGYCGGDDLDLFAAE